jgi:energy-coupling factor transporter ATP-binding protein EcfA2
VSVDSGAGTVSGSGTGPGTEAAPARLTVGDLSVRYAGRREPALSDISLEVPAGGFVGVHGRTGAGKSTLALAAAGFIPRVVRAHLEGTVAVDGIAVATAAAADLAERVGIVFSTPANQLSASKLTVREELAFGLENLAVPRSEMDGRIEAVLDRLGIGHLADREPFTLSGGEQQRVAIASIVAMGTSTLVLDEPTAQLDPAGTRAVADLLRTLTGEGRAVLCVEHDPAVLGRTDRILVLEGGRSASLAEPGRALGSGVLGPLGLESPTLVRLAELAGLPPERAFDETALGEALRGLGSSAGARPTPTGAEPTARAEPTAGSSRVPDWRPLRDLAPVVVEATGLVHRYPGGVEAVRGVDLRIEPGEAVAIVGQNGSGKTTLAKHLDGLLRPAAGTVLIGGRDIAGDAVSEIARTVGFVFQNPDDQLFQRSVEREVRFGPANLELEPRLAAELVERALALTGLADVRATNPYDLGLSIRKLVALASVLAMEPAVLVLDEPTTGQDGPGVERVGGVVDAYRGAGRTVVAITHDMEFAAAHFGRILVMRDGRIAADGPPSEVFAPGRSALLASTGLDAPPAARLGAALGLGSTPTFAILLTALARG